MPGSPKKRERKERIQRASDPLDEAAPLPALDPIPWNKKLLTDEGRDAVAAALMAGHPRNRIAKALGTTVKTLKRLIDESPSLTDAVDAKRDADEAELRDILMGLARKGDTVAAIFLGKSQFGWRDRDDARMKLEADGGGVLVVPGTMPLDEWTAAAADQQRKHREPSAEVAYELAKQEAETRQADRPHEGTPGNKGCGY